MKALETIKKLNDKKELISSKINPNEESKEIYALSALFYTEENYSVDYKINRFTSEEKEIELVAQTTVELSLAELNKVTRAKWDDIFVEAYLINNEILDIKTIYGNVKPLYFPKDNSNVAIYTNNKLESSYVNDGRVVAVNNKLYLISSTQLALEKFEKNRLEAKEKKSLKRFLTEEYFPRENEDGNIPTKGVIFLDKTSMMNFPEMLNGEPYNRGWHFDGEPLFSVVRENRELRKYIRYSSLSQTGDIAFLGHIGETKLIRISDFETRAFEIKECTNQFVDSNSKLDISATQGAKSCFKTLNKNKELLVLLCEVWNAKGNPVNVNGNCLATPEAFDVYKTIFTVEKGKKDGVKYPAHKVFAYKGNEIVRAKGACRIIPMQAYPVGEQDKATKEIVVFPPREVKHNGVEEDIKKFQSLAEGKELKKYVLEYEGRQFECYGITAMISEDPHHSGVTSLKEKEQNYDYYGAISEIYRNNGLNGLVKYYKGRINHSKLSHALNVCGLDLFEEKEIDINDFEL